MLHLLWARFLWSNTTELLQREPSEIQSTGDIWSLFTETQYQCVDIVAHIQAPDWRNPSSHKEFFSQLGRALNVHRPSDWYKVTREDVRKYGGLKLLEQYYSNSFYKVDVFHCGYCEGFDSCIS